MTLNEAAAPDFKPGYFPVGSKAASMLVFPFIGQYLLIGADAEPVPLENLRDLGAPLRTLCFGMLTGQECVLEVWPSGLSLPAGVETGDYRKLWGRWPAGRSTALIRARQLAAWVLQNRFCGVCGHAMDSSAAEIACVCPACGYKAYPRISPVAIGLIVRGDAILLARSPHFAPGMYSALAGFVEAGESAEDCLRREVREEAGIGIQNLRYFGSQSWPYPHSLMIGFIADYLSGELLAQEGEIEDLGWFKRDELPVLPHPASLARRMIESVLSGQTGKISPP
ncbi:MAG: NAD(+) diphosphatase [Azoarcus sp.]|jgi:NAD+ diphosphatase|nr:NAD(+) diphosphatase [Azoarcus sp.]